MFSTVIFQDGQIATEQDFNNLGAFPRVAFDTILKDIGAWPAPRFAGFAVEAIGQTTLRVGSGRLYRPTGIAHSFEDAGGVTIDLLDFLPVLAKRVATIVVFGNTVDTDIEPREFVINVDDGTTEGREVAVESRRVANVDKILGAENATPVPGAISSDYVAIAHVVLTTTGIESITTLSENRVPTIYKNSQSIDLINARLTAVGSQIDTLRSDMAGLGSNVRSKADSGFVQSLAIQVARLKDIARLPDDYVEYAVDTFATDNESDTAAAGYSARIFEGLRFPSANGATVFTALANPADPALRVEGNMALPVYTSQPRISIVGKDSEYPLTNTTSTTQEARSVTEARTVQVAAGTETVQVLVNQGGQYLTDGKGSLTPIRKNEVPSANYQTASSGNTVSTNNQLNTFTVPKYVEQTVYSSRTEYVANTVNITGSFTGQTFLNSQEGYITGFDLYFSKKASSGDVRVLLVDTNSAGVPLFDRVLEQTLLTAANIKVWPEATTVNIKPAHALKGKRYAVVLASSSPHFISQVSGNKLAQGALFYFQDGKFVQSSADLDMAMQVRFAEFSVARLTIGLAPLELAGGIDSIRINSDVALPEGTDIIYEILNNNVWRALSEGKDGTNILLGNPSLVQFRAILVGTTDAMPALGVGATRSEVTLTRPGAAFLHVSKPRILAAPTDKIEVEIRIENWDASNGHALNCVLLAGGTYAVTETPDATVTRLSLDGAATIKAFTFLVVDITQFKIKLTGARTAGSAKTFHVSERLDTEFA